MEIEPVPPLKPAAFSAGARHVFRFPQIWYYETTSTLMPNWERGVAYPNLDAKLPGSIRTCHQTYSACSLLSNGPISPLTTMFLHLASWKEKFLQPRCNAATASFYVFIVEVGSERNESGVSETVLIFWRSCFCSGVSAALNLSSAAWSCPSVFSGQF